MKTADTLRLEQGISRVSRHNGWMGCAEVTIGFAGKERVDFLAYAFNGDWRCFEIKTSVKDFHSQNANSFFGNFNYYVLTKPLYEKVCAEIPRSIGIYVEDALVRKPRRTSLSIRETILFESLVRSLYRDACTIVDSENVEKQIKQGTEIRRLQRELRDARSKYFDLQTAVRMNAASREEYKRLIGG